MSTFSALFTVSTVVLFVIAGAVLLCLGAAKVYRMAFGARPDDGP